MAELYKSMSEAWAELTPEQRERVAEHLAVMSLEPSAAMIREAVEAERMGGAMPNRPQQQLNKASEQE